MDRHGSFGAMLRFLHFKLRNGKPGVPAGVLAGCMLSFSGAGYGVSGKPLSVRVEVRALENGSVVPSDLRVEARNRATSLVHPGRRAPGLGSFDLLLDEDGDWEIEAVRSGWWSSKIAIRVPSLLSGSTVVMYAAPATYARIGLAPERGAPPLEVDLRFLRRRQVDSGEVLSIEQSCARRERTVECPVPVGVWDVRIGASGMIPVYFWNQSLESGKPWVVSGVKLERGSSVAGSVSADRDAGPVAGVAVRLSPVVLGGRVPSAGAPADETRDYTERSDPRGRFQFRGVAPGTYELSASSPAGARGSFAPLQVLVDSESMLERPVRLALPVRATLVVDPPLAPSGGEWAVGVFREDAVAGTLEASQAAATAQGGVVQVGPLEPGPYEAVLTDVGGRFRVVRHFELRGPGDVVAIAVEFLDVQGRVTRGGQPVAADLWFGGRRGDERVHVRSDEAGRFELALPGSGTWRIEVESVSPRARTVLPRMEIEPRPGYSSAEIEIELSQGALSGSVTSAAGEPIAGAEVRAVLQDDVLVASTATSDSRGRFEMPNLGEGRYWVRGRAKGGESDQVAVEIAESSRPEIHLKVESARRLVGSVLGAFGPVPGALVYFDDSRGNQAMGTSGADGTFTLSIRSSVRSGSIVVLPPGHVLSVFPQVVVEEGPAVLQVQTAGGELAVGFTEADEQGGEPLVVIKDGVSIPLALLYRWVGANGGASLRAIASAGPEVVFQRLDPGGYSVCRARNAGAGFTLDPCVAAQVAVGSLARVAAPASPRGATP